MRVHRPIQPAVAGSSKPTLPKRAAAYATAVAIACSAVAAGPLAGTASAAPSCGANEYIEQIKVEHVEGPDFKIVVMPTSKARWAAVKGDLHGSTVTMWHAIQGCVPGLYGGLADSIWQQLACHQWGALIKKKLDGSYATGNTYDLESWRIPLASPGVGEYQRTQCLNLINKDGEGSGINFPGSLDLLPIPDNLA